jgi:argininosuccinate lyase
METSLYAPEDAYRMVLEEDMPFREAYRKVGRRYSGKD